MRYVLAKLYIILFLVLLSAVAKSQENGKGGDAYESTFSMFREPSYITALGGFGNIEPLMFEADIVPYYMLSLNKNSRWGIELSPRIMRRMYNEDSYPVRTPSFMPRATFFYKVREGNSHQQGFFTYLSWCHHSNGQNGSFYNNDSVTINTQTGNFSTNMVETGVFLSHPDRKVPYAVNYIKLSACYHYHQAPELRSIYGRWRFFSDFQSSVNLSKVLRAFGRSANNPVNHNAFLSQSIRVGWIGGDIAKVGAIDAKRLIFRYTISFKPSFLNDVTLFAQYYYGQDYYNINFSRTLKVLRFGFAAKASIFN